MASVIVPQSVRVAFIARILSAELSQMAILTVGSIPGGDMMNSVIVPRSVRCIYRTIGTRCDLTEEDDSSLAF